MALVTRDSSASIDASTGSFAPQITGDLIAGEDLDTVAPCYIKNSDGKVYMSNATAANEASKVAGFTPRAYKAGQAVTLFGLGTRFRYAASGTLTPGNLLYVGATAGRLNDAATVGDRFGVVLCINDTDIQVMRWAHDTGTLGLAGAGVFVSAEQTGNGGAQNVAHGLGVAPSKVVVVPTDLTPATVGQYSAVEGAHDATNVVVTVTNGKKYKVIAWA